MYFLISLITKTSIETTNAIKTPKTRTNGHFKRIEKSVEANILHIAKLGIAKVHVLKVENVIFYSPLAYFPLFSSFQEEQEPILRLDQHLHLLPDYYTLRPQIQEGIKLQ